MKKNRLLLIVILFIGIPSIVNAVCIKKDVSNMNGINTNISFDKRDEENGKKLIDAKFKVTTIDKKEIPVEVIYENNHYIIGNTKNNFSAEELYDISPKYIQDLYKNVNSPSDLNELIGTGQYAFEDTVCAFWYENGNEVNGTSKYLNYRYPLILEETESPSGYIKEDYIVLANFTIRFNYKSSNEEISSKQILLSLTDTFYKFNSSTNYNALTESKSYEGYITNKKGNVIININNYIENKSEFTTNSNSNVKYKIVVSNKGEVASNNNTIKTTIPKGLKVKEESISDNGKYNSKNNEIIWSIDYIEPKSDKDLYFEIIVPGSVKGQFKIFSTLESEEVNITAPKTILNVNNSEKKLETIENPKTYTGSFIKIIIIVLIISGITVITIKKKNKYCKINNII